MQERNPVVHITRAVGGGYVLHARTWLERPREDVFAFFADPANLERITPPFLRFAIVTPPPITMRRGARIDYRLRVRGIPIRWRSAITVWEPGVCFVDEQRHGPYRWWIHEHRFADEAGGTAVEDVVQYAPRGGALLHRAFVRRDLERIFTFRRDAVARIFDGDRIHAAAPSDSMVDSIASTITLRSGVSS